MYSEGQGRESLSWAAEFLLGLDLLMGCNVVMVSNYVLFFYVLSYINV